MRDSNDFPFTRHGLQPIVLSLGLIQAILLWVNLLEYYFCLAGDFLEPHHLSSSCFQRDAIWVSLGSILFITVDGLFFLLLKMHVLVINVLMVCCLTCSLLMVEPWFPQQFMHAVVCLIS